MRSDEVQGASVRRSYLHRHWLPRAELAQLSDLEGFPAPEARTGVYLPGDQEDNWASHSASLGLRVLPYLRKEGLCYGRVCSNVFGLVESPLIRYNIAPNPSRSNSQSQSSLPWLKQMRRGCCSPARSGSPSHPEVTLGEELGAGGFRDPKSPHGLFQ